MSKARDRLRPWTRAGVDLMADGPRLRTAVMAAGAANVPPGYALRVHDRWRGNPRKMPTEHRIAVGQRWVTGKNFTSMIRHGKIIETTNEEGEVFWELSSDAHRLLTK